MLDITSVSHGLQGIFSILPNQLQVQALKHFITFTYCPYIALVTFGLFATIEIHTGVEGITPFPLAVIHLWLCSLQ